MNKTLPPRVTIVEVGPRDGFQMEKAFIPTTLKIETIDQLARAGLRKIEATSFVKAKMIPQMADAAAVMAGIERRPATAYTALVPNLKGAERAVAARADGVRLVVCATETYNQRNVGMSVRRSLDASAEIQAYLAGERVAYEVVIGLAFGCPFEGEVPLARVLELAREVAGQGVREISVADSVGLAQPLHVRRVVEALREALPTVAFSLHIHNTRGLGLANVLAALQAGIDTFDSALGGLGGCPIFPGATGNIPTEDLVNLCEEMGIATGVAIESVRGASRRIQEFLGRSLPGHVLRVDTRPELLARIESLSSS